MLWRFRSRLKFEDLAAVVNRRYPTHSCRWRRQAMIGQKQTLTSEIKLAESTNQTFMSINPRVLSCSASWHECPASGAVNAIARHLHNPLVARWANPPRHLA